LSTCSTRVWNHRRGIVREVPAGLVGDALGHIGNGEDRVDDQGRAATRRRKGKIVSAA
jgi:hypothetical protein